MKIGDYIIRKNYKGRKDFSIGFVTGFDPDNDPKFITIYSTTKEESFGDVWWDYISRYSVLSYEQVKIIVFNKNAG
jgi:hypothetical protein|tara:strand:- start:7590 stop:7817 length:228 start_codon:yes stop_codon:yes gene_type:complete